jgi:DNA-binding NarL/FixJ family response regulator
MPKLRLLIADDQPLMRAGFRAVLEATGEMEVVAEAGDGLEAVSAARATKPDVVLMDIRMPNLDGIEAIRRLPHHRVLILTTFGLDEYIVEALRAGASGFITKDVPADELVRAVRVVASGEARSRPRSHASCWIGWRGGCPRRSGTRRSRWPSSPTGSARCWSCWRAACPTPRSPRRWSSATPR